VYYIKNQFTPIFPLFVTSLHCEVLNPGWDEIFRTFPDRMWGPPSLLYIGYRIFPGAKLADAWR